MVEWPTLLAVLPIVLFSGFVHGALGLGFPMIATPIIAIFLDVKLAIFITALPTAAVNLASVWSGSPSSTTLRKYSPLAGASLAGAVIGSIVLATSDANPFRLLLALLILFFLWTSHQQRWPKAWVLNNGLLAMLLFGVLGGFSAGTTNVAVAVLIVYFLTLEVPRNELVPAMNLCFLLGKLSQIVVFLWIGVIGFGFLASTIPLTLGALGALFVGQRLGKSIPQERYRRILRIILAVLAVVLLVQFIAAVSGNALYGV
ncbi:hypothetical protein AB833_06320 [Chromatiales bacterium (ex Bugula neritina AB1)]|nr:hypothetical protein AB833_06320 [Chromatiales bacterium (ex Bugula neritina AB1)]